MVGRPACSVYGLFGAPLLFDRLQFTESFYGVVPYGLAFAAGAMLFVVYKELIPESHGDGNERASTFSFILGLLTMIGLTHVLK